MSLATTENVGGGNVHDVDGRLVVVGPGGVALGPGTGSTATVTSVASSASSVTILASNTNRLGAYVYNDSTAVLYLKFGTTASSSDYTVQLSAGAYYELPRPTYTGRIDGIWASANGNARVTEVTA